MGIKNYTSRQDTLLLVQKSSQILWLRSRESFQHLRGRLVIVQLPGTLFFDGPSHLVRLPSYY